MVGTILSMTIAFFIFVIKLNAKYDNKYKNKSQKTYRQPVQTRTQGQVPIVKPMQVKEDSVEHSVTNYLHKKAMADQREHAKEKMEERKRLSEKYGGRAIAMRYLPGDRIPHGMRVVNCSYCNAENLVETIRTERACYFCRTKL